MTDAGVLSLPYAEGRPRYAGHVGVGGFFGDRAVGGDPARGLPASQR